MASVPSVIEQQTRWAVSKGLAPKNAYLKSVSDNLQADLSEGAFKDFERGSGGELRKRGLRPPKMWALRSSAALTANVFDYWRSHDPAPLQNALSLSDKITKIGFEEHFPTGLRGNPPNGSSIRSTSRAESCGRDRGCPIARQSPMISGRPGPSSFSTCRSCSSTRWVSLGRRLGRTHSTTSTST
jgi:hypothetical protein